MSKRKETPETTEPAEGCEAGVPEPDQPVGAPTSRGRGATEEATAEIAGAPEEAPCGADLTDRVSTVPAEARRRLCRVALSETSRLRAWVDPQTHLRVTHEEQTVPIERIGEACRREPAVIVQEV